MVDGRWGLSLEPPPSTPAWRYQQGAWSEHSDALAPEEPLELRLSDGLGPERTLTTLMRTPGHDLELLLGWLCAEGLLPEEYGLSHDQQMQPNVWLLRTPQAEALLASARLTLTNSACGVCGTGNIEQLLGRSAPLPFGLGWPSAELLAALPDRLMDVQPGFARTGGLHAAALFDHSGELLCAFEDVGRHNATDKVLGWLYLTETAPEQTILCVSSRAGFEIVQKAVVGRIPAVVAVGAATSLAVETAQAFGLTLIAFARQGRMTVYAGKERLMVDG